jgi:stage II sporulation protein AA (anti-sigma F factor antagonist)
MEFSSSATQDAGRVVLAIAGDVDLAAEARFRADVDRAWDGSTDLVVDCSQVDFLDSMGLRVLMRARQRAADNSRAVIIAAPSEQVRRVLQLAGVAKLFTVEGPVAGSEPDAGHR